MTVEEFHLLQVALVDVFGPFVQVWVILLLVAAAGLVLLMGAGFLLREAVNRFRA